MLLPLPIRHVRFSRNPDQAPSKALQVVTGYCRPSGQDISAALGSHLKQLVLAARRDASLSEDVPAVLGCFAAASGDLEHG